MRGCWRVASRGRVRPTANREKAFQIGRSCGRQAIAAMKGDRKGLISLFISGMIRDCVERAAKTGRRRQGPTAWGFLAEISQSVGP
jgi:hypothetical protein